MSGFLAGVALSGLLVIAQVPKPDTSPEAVAGRLGEQLRKNPVKPNDGTLPLFVLDTQSGDITRIVDKPAAGLTACRLAEWSHDGRRIVFQADDGNFWNGRLSTIELGQEKPIVKSIGIGAWPSISHDSEQIFFELYQGMDGATESSIWVMNVDGTGRKKLEPEGRARMAPDTRFCLICSLTKPPTLRLVDTSLEKVFDVELPNRTFFSWPSWVDAKTFVAMTGAEVGDHMSLIDVSKPERIALKEDLWSQPEGSQMRPRSPVYFPAAKHGYFIAREPGKTNAVYEMVPGKPALRRFDKAIGDELEGLGMSPGGRYLLFSSDKAGK